MHEHSPCKHLRGHLLLLGNSQTRSACHLTSSVCSLYPVQWSSLQGQDWWHVYLLECISGRFPSLRAAGRILGTAGCKAFLLAWEASAFFGGPPCCFWELGTCPVRTVSCDALISWSPLCGGGKNLRVSASKLEPQELLGAGYGSQQSKPPPLTPSVPSLPWQVTGWPAAGVPSEGAPPRHLLPPVAMA